MSTTEPTPQHTALPLTSKMDVFGGNRLFVYDANGTAVAEMCRPSVKCSESQQREHCRLIVTAVNSHAELVRALELAEEQMADEARTAVRMGLHDALRIARAALANVAKNGAS